MHFSGGTVFRGLLLPLALLSMSACALLQRDEAVDVPRPPLAAQIPHVVEAPAGDRVDPYYWLRDDAREAPEMLAHLEAENRYTEAMTAPWQALEERLFEEIVGRIQQDDSSVPVFDNGYWYYTRFETGREYAIHARRKGDLNAPEEVLLDVNTLAEGHGFYQLGGAAVSPDNRWLAYAEDSVGRRQFVLRIKDLEGGETSPPLASNIQPGVVWANDNRTVLYVEKDAETLLGYKVKAHRRGNNPAEDRLVYEESDRSFYMGLARAKSGRYLFIGLQSTLVSEWHYADADDSELNFRPVLPRKPDHEYAVEHVGGDFIIRTNWQAPNFRIMRAPVTHSADKRRWRDVVPHRDEVFIAGFDAFNDFLAVNERSEGLLKIRIRSWDGRRDDYTAADEPAYATYLQSLPDPASAVVRYIYTSLTTPPTTYDVDVASGQRRLLKREPVLGEFDPDAYVTEYRHAIARDGTRVPVSLVYRRGVERNGSAPLLQFGYGSYGASMDPVFRSALLSLLDRGFVFAIAHIRGGQEMGRRWYEDGKLERKWNTFNDFIDVTRFLVKEGYAAPDQVFATGGSAGGLLMGAVVNERPDLYRGVVAHVPFVDVVSTMLDESIPLTTNEFDEWGNPKDETYYHVMLSYSPYDNVRRQDYPAMLVTTGLWDSQVQYWEPAKWVARLRTHKTDDNLLLLRTNMEAGHGGRSGRFQRLREIAQDYAFILGVLGRDE
jgi:oligopeptidase B